MKVKPRIALITGSTRPSRFADKPAKWMLKQVQARDELAWWARDHGGARDCDYGIGRPL